MSKLNAELLAQCVDDILAYSQVTLCDWIEGGDVAVGLGLSWVPCCA